MGSSGRTRSVWGRRGLALRAAAAVALALALPGCGVPYLLRAGYQEARILWGREPIEQLLAQPNLPAPERKRLELVLAVTSFATRELGLPGKRAYRTVAPRGVPGQVFVVGAAYRDRLEPYTWWYPLLGRLPYRGFFSRARAERAAAKLARRGLDTVVRPAVAFSTLGWFADPLPRALLSAPPVVVAEVVIHELFHGLVYLPGRATFNESAANFVGHRGAVAFFCAPTVAATDAAARQRNCAAARRRWEGELARSRVLAALARRLRALYARRLQPAALAAARARAFAAARSGFQRIGAAGAPLARGPLNNAVVLQELLYTTHLGLFERLYAAEGGDLRRTIDSVVGAARSARCKPFARLRAVVGQVERAAANCTDGSCEGSVEAAGCSVARGPLALHSGS